MGSKILKTIGKIAPIAAAFIPGIGPLGAAAIGAGGGLLSGGGLKGALLGGATGALGGGLGSSIAGAAGLSGAGANALSGALTGAAGGLYNGGGLKSALLGGALGGAGGALLGNSPGTALDKTSGLAGAQGPTQGTGLLKASGSSSGGLSGLLSGGGGISSYLGPASTIYSGIQSSSAQDELEKELLAAQGKSAQALSPYTASGKAANAQLSQNLAEGFNPGDLASDPGYQFQLQQGTDALNKSLGASGNLFSGRALQEAQKFGQGLASTTYDNAYNRWLQGNQQLAQQAGQGLSATGALTNVYDNQGNIQANNTLGKSNILNSTLSSLFGGNSLQAGLNGTINPNLYANLTPEQRKALGLA